MPETTYVSLLRGINVAGQKIVPMVRLRAVFEKLEFGDVRTYVQSGNVVFKARAQSTAALAAKIEQMIQLELEFDVPVAVRSASELASIARRNPFAKEPKVVGARLYVAFLFEAAAKSALRGLERYAVNGERMRLSGRELFIDYPASYGKSKLSNGVIERVLGVTATMRNWNTVLKLKELSQD